MVKVAFQTLTKSELDNAETLSRLVGKVVYLPGSAGTDSTRIEASYMYVVAALGSTLTGVGLGTRTGTWSAYGWATVDTANGVLDTHDGQTGYAYPITQVSEWPGILETFFQSPPAPVAASDDGTGETPEQAFQRGQAEARRQHERELERINEFLIERAQANGLCSEFERAMEELGWRGREAEYAVTVDISTSTVVYVTARNDEEASEIVYGDPWSYVDSSTLKDNASLDISEVELA